MSPTPRQIKSVSNAELYNQWAKVYDTDGNILQAIDDILLPPLLSQALTCLLSSAPLTIIELGSGTGRNTAKLLLPPLSSIASIRELNALDLSPSMLEVAKHRCKSLLSSTVAHVLPALKFQVFDALESSSSLDDSLNGKADLVLSTLVLEHLPLDIFFKTVTVFLKPDGYLVLTNMHGDMGRMSQAGFVDPDTGEKVRGTSHVYDIEEVIDEASKHGIEILGDVEERAVREDDIGDGRVLGLRGNKWIGVKVWFGMLMRLRSGRTK